MNYKFTYCLLLFLAWAIPQQGYASSLTGEPTVKGGDSANKYKATACPVSNLSLTTQAAVNAFPTTYAGCTTITGDLSIETGNINNLTPLSSLTTITGKLEVRNTSVSSLQGLHNLTFIGGALRLFGNTALTNVGALSNITSLGGDLEIWSNTSLSNLTGLSNLASVGTFIQMGFNHALTNFNGLQNITSMNGFLLIQNHNNLTGLTGLQNLHGLTSLTIKDNPLLSSCSVESICNYLGVPANAATIQNNATNCASRTAVVANCPVPVCPTGNVTLTSQAEVNNFQAMYPNCTQITGNLTIQGSNITDLTPLSNLTYVSGLLDIRNNPLTTLNGLHNLTAIGGNFNLFGNGNLTHVNALSNLTSIGGGLEVWLATSLQNLSGMSNVTSIGGSIGIGFSHTLTNLNGLHNVTSTVPVWIQNNNNLTSLNGLHNLGGITSLTIKDNPLLNECDILPVCNFVGNYTKDVTIFGNATGCASRSAVVATCENIPVCPPGDVELTSQNQVTAFGQIYPNCHVINGKLKMYGNITSLLPLSQIQQVNGWLDIAIPVLPSLQGLEGVTTVGGNLNVFSCSTLTNLNGLNNITSIGGEMTIWSSGALTNIAALSNVTHIGGLIQIGFNNSLPNLNGLDNVSSTVGVLIRNNNVLTNIDGIDNINLTFLDIQNNPLLSSCSIYNICNYLSIPANSALIANNGINCTSRSVVQANCPCAVPVPGNTVASSTTACAGSTVNLSLQNNISGGGVTYQWYNSSGPIQGATSATYTTYALTGNETFYCEVTCNIGPTMATSTPILITTVAPPNGGTAAGPASDFTHNNTTFTTTGAVGNLQWQAANSYVPVTFVNMPGFTANTAVFNFNGPDTYVIRCKASVPGCPDAFSNEVAVSITVNGDNVCSAIPLTLGNNGSFSNLGATGEPGEVSPPPTGCNNQTGWCSGTSANAVLNSVWFTFTPAVSGKYEFRLDPTKQLWDSQFALYSAPACSPFSNFTLVAANDDGTFNPPYDSHILPVCLLGGLTYYLKVDGYDNTQAPIWGVQVNKASNIAPVFSYCPGTVSVCGTNVVNFSPPTAFDDCGSVTMMGNYQSGDFFPNGSTVVTYVATDTEGASSSCSFTVNVNPLLSPCPSNVTVCGTNIANYTPPTSFAECGPVTITSNYNPGDEFPMGVTIVTYNATSQSGNTASCSFNVTVRDLLTPCPSNFTVCGTNTVVYTAPTSYEDCDAVTITSNYDPGDEFPAGVTVVTYTATNQNGNSASCSFEVKVSPAINFNATIVQPVCATYTGSVSLGVSGGIAPLTYNPSNPPTANLSAGNYTYQVSDAYGCSAETTVAIIAPANPCLPPSPVCGNIIDVYANASNLVYNGPGTADVYLIPAAALDGGSFSLLPNTLSRQVKRVLTNVGFNWTTSGACVDATPNGIYNNIDKGLVYKNCLPVTPADFNLIRNFDMTLTDYFGTSVCGGRYRVIFGYPPGGTQPETQEDPEAYTRTTTEHDTDLQIFPNPGTDQVFISTTIKEGEVYSLYILDMFGKEVKKWDQLTDGFVSIETTDLVPGTYTIMLRGEESIKTRKWLKVN